MTKYEEMCSAADLARKNWLAFETRAVQAVVALVHGLDRHCGIPSQAISFLRWTEGANHSRTYEGAKENVQYSIPGAMMFDEEAQHFHLGIKIVLTPQNHFPKQWIFFVVLISEKDGKTIFKLGITGRGFAANTSSQADLVELCGEIANLTIKAFAEPKTSISEGQRSIGFVTGAS